MSADTVAAAAEHGQEAAEAASKSIPEIPNLITLVTSFFAKDHPVVGFLHSIETQFFALIVILFLTWVVRRAYASYGLIPSPLQNVIEMYVEIMEGLVVGVLGEKEGRRYLPFVGTLFIYILTMNLAGLFPFMKSATSVIYTTAGLAISVFCYVQYNALKRLGPSGFIHHLMGSPRDVIGWCLVPLFLPLHIMEEFIKPVSLACRLFGNILGEDILLGVALMLGISITAFVHIPVGIPLHFPFMFLAMLTGTIQALVFALLSTVYISMILPHGEEQH